MNNQLADHRRRAAELGLTRMSVRSCPRRLVRKPHLELECWCTSRLNDHGRRWRDGKGRPVVMWEPYDASPGELTEVFTAAAADGLHISVTGMSPWNPGRTFSLVFRA